MKSILRVFAILRELRWRLIAVVITNAVLGLGALAVPYFFKIIVDQIAAQLKTHNTAAVTSHIYHYLLVLLAVEVFITLTGYLQEFMQDHLRLDIFLGLRERMMEHVMTLSLDYFETNQAGAIGDKLTQGVLDFGLWADDLMQTSLLQIFTVLFAVTIIATRSPLAGLIAAVVVIAKVTNISTKVRLVRPYRHRARAQYLEIQGLMVESISNIATIRSVSSEEGVLTRFHEMYKKHRAIRYRQIVVERRFNALTQLLDGAGIVVVVGIVALGVAAGHYTIGDVLLVSSYFIMASSALNPLARFMDRTADVEVTAAGIVELLDVEPTVIDAPEARHLTELRSIEFQKVSFSYPGHHVKVLDGVSFMIEGDKTLALVGPSGTGKTTITKLLLRFYEPSSGQILVNGEDIRSFTQDSLRKHFGVVMQDVALFNTSFEENLRLARPKATKAELDDVINRAYLREFLDELSDGYATQVGERGIKLSGGQKQRLAIARAMLRDPQLIILDEATSALDSESERAVQAGLHELMAGRMAVIIAHRLSTVRHAEEIIVIKRGKIVERGDHAELLEKDGLYAKLYKMQGKL